MLVALLLDLFQPLLLPLLLLFFLFLVPADILFEVLEPLFVVIENGQYSLPGFVLIVLLNGHQAQLLARVDPSAELPECRYFYFFLLMEGLSLGLEQRSTPL